MKTSVIITSAKETSIVLFIMPKEVKKDNMILKRLNVRRLALKKLRPVMETFESNQCHFCERMSDELLHDIRQDSKDLELKTAFRESMSIVIRNL